jgi:hypothetical protein
MSNDPTFPENQAAENHQDLQDAFVGFTAVDSCEPAEPAVTTTAQPETIQPPPPTTWPTAPATETDVATTISAATNPDKLSSLSALEKLSIKIVLAVLLVAAAFTIYYFSRNIPVKSPISRDLKLPVKGERFTVSSVESYWRKPNTRGENPDIIRSGVELAPVLKIKITGDEGAIRIFFRDSDGIMIGDSVSRNISGSETHEFIATDGLAHLGAHAAYRTGENPRWIIHVYEGPSADAPLTQFKKLLETKISADIREKTQDEKTQDTGL